MFCSNLIIVFKVWNSKIAQVRHYICKHRDIYSTYNLQLFACLLYIHNSTGDRIRNFQFRFIIIIVLVCSLSLAARNLAASLLSMSAEVVAYIDAESWHFCATEIGLESTTLHRLAGKASTNINNVYVFV